MVQSLKRILTPWNEDIVPLAFDDPKIFKASGVTGIQFGKILNALQQSNDEELLVRAIGAFSAACSEKEWYDLYKPILTRARPAGLTIGWFNAVFTDEPIIPFQKENKIEDGRIIPKIPNSNYGYVILWENGVETVNSDFSSRRTYHRKIIDSIPRTELTFIEVFIRGKTIFVSDIYTMNSHEPLHVRIPKLEVIWSSYLSDNDDITIVDFMPMDMPLNSIREHFTMVCGMDITKGLVKADTDFLINFREIEL